MRSAVRLVVLDMAGTTVRDDGLVLESFIAAADHVGLRATREVINAHMGGSKRAVFGELARAQLGPGVAADALRDRAYEVFRAVLEGAYARGGVVPIAGADEAFAALRARGVRVALNTGFYRRVTELIVDALGWRHTVDAVVCDDDVPEGRPAPYMIHIAMQRCGIHAVGEVAAVGDTPSDIVAARNAGACAAIGVTTGAHRAGELRRAGATHVVESVRTLDAVIKVIERLEG